MYTKTEVQVCVWMQCQLSAEEGAVTSYKLETEHMFIR